MKKSKKKSTNTILGRFTKFFVIPKKKADDPLLSQDDCYYEIGDLFSEHDRKMDTLEVPRLPDDVYASETCSFSDPLRSFGDEADGWADDDFPFEGESDSKKLVEPILHPGGTEALPIFTMEAKKIKDALRYRKIHQHEYCDLLEYEFDVCDLIPEETISFEYLNTPCELKLPEKVTVLSDSDHVTKIIVRRPKAYYRLPIDPDSFPFEFVCAADEKHYALFDCCGKDLVARSLLMDTYATLSPAQRGHVMEMASRPVCEDEKESDADVYTPIRGERSLRMMYQVCKKTYSPSVRARIEQLFAELKEASHSDRPNLLNQLAITLGINTVPKTHPHRTYEELMEIMDKHIYGMGELKESVVEFIMALQLSGSTYFSVLLVGPPGVGKTCVCNAFAECMDVPLVHIDCSGIDYIAMNGLVKSYSGAKPGKVVDGLFEKGATDVLVLLDEVDKMGRSKEGDPYGALIKPLGPHRKYFDEFVADDIDVSATKFIATANDVSQIPGYILSRFQNCVFYIDAYTPEEKVEIATNYVIPKCLKIYNLADEECRFDGEAVRLIVDEFCHDEGIRELEGNIVLLLRKAITEYARGIIQKPMHIDCEYVRSHLKKNKVTKGKNTAGFAS